MENDAQREREYWSAFEIFAHEIKKNEQNIEEWKKYLESPEGAYYSNLIKDAATRNALLWKRISELDSKPTEQEEDR